MRFNCAEDVLQALIRGYYEERSVASTLECVTDDIEWIGTENNDSASGKAALKRLLETDVAAHPEAFGVETHQPSAQMIGREAVIYTVLGTQKNVPGIAEGLSVRGTVCCVKTADGWRANYIHTSTPSSEAARVSLQNELSDERGKQEALLSNVPGGMAIYRVKKDGRIATDYVSDGLAKICGYDDGKDIMRVMAEDSRRLVLAEDFPVVAAACLASLETGVPTNVNYRIHSKSGAPVRITLDSVVMKNAELGADDVAVFYAVQTLVNNETARMIDERTRLKRLVDEVPVGLGIYEITDTKMDQTYMNEAFYAMLGVDRSERAKYTREGAMLSAHPEDLHLLKEAIEGFRAGKDSAEVTYRIRDVGAGWFWLHLSAQVVERNDEYILVYGAFSDFNQIKEAEMKNSLEQERFRTVAEEMNAAVFEWNKADNRFYCSAAYQNYAVSRVNMEDVMNNSGPGDTVHPEDRDKLRAFFADTEAEKPKVESVLRLKMMDGSYRWCRMIALFYRDDNGEVIKKVGILIDINDEHEENVHLQERLDAIPGGLGRYDYHDGVLELVYMNDAYFSMLGLKRDECRCYSGVNNMKAVHPEDAVKTMRILDELAAGRQRADLYQRVTNGKGGWYWMKLVIGVTERRDGHTYMMAVISNCDELIRTQEAMQAKYEDQVRFARMMASDAVASSMVNLTTQIISMQNTDNDDIMEIITNQTPQQGFEAMYSCIPDAQIRDAYAKVFDSQRIIEDFARGIDHKSIRHPYMNVDCWYESSYNAVRNPKTNDLEVYCVARDVSQETQNEHISNTIMTHAYDEVILIDAETGEPQVLVEKGESGVYEEQAKAGDYNVGLRNYILHCCADEHPEAVAESLSLRAVRSALSEQDVYTVTYAIFDAQGGVARRSAAYSYLNKYRTKLLCVVQDITGAFEKEASRQQALQQALTQAQNASRAKAEFYSRMSHDMRTPMNGILGMAELSADEEDSAKLRENMAKIRESGEYLLSLVNDTLDLQRIESGKMVLEPKIVSTMDMVANILDMVRMSAKTKGVTLKYSKGNTDLDWYVRIDALRIKQVFINLLSNAIKFTPEGGTVEMEFKLLSREGMISHDVVYVRDTGIGMSREFIQNGIFKPFSQESSAVSTLYAGSGLGLSIAKSLVEMMGGHIEVESELGVGTTFAVYIDFERVSESEAERAEQHKKKEVKDFSAALRGKVILLAEDHPLNAEIATRVLEKIGCKVIWAKDGSEAVKTFEKAPAHAIDAILMDIRMPVMDGLEAAKHIRALGKDDALRVPIIAMTANAYEDDINASLKAGMNAHLGKPVEPMVLYETLARSLAPDKA